jgi:hypothetical protein
MKVYLISTENIKIMLILVAELFRKFHENSVQQKLTQELILCAETNIGTKHLCLFHHKLGIQNTYINQNQSTTFLKKKRIKVLLDTSV